MSRTEQKSTLELSAQNRSFEMVMFLYQKVHHVTLAVRQKVASLSELPRFMVRKMAITSAVEILSTEAFSVRFYYSMIHVETH